MKAAFAASRTPPCSAGSSPSGQTRAGASRSGTPGMRSQAQAPACTSRRACICLTAASLSSPFRTLQAMVRCSTGGPGQALGPSRCRDPPAAARCTGGGRLAGRGGRRRGRGPRGRRRRGRRGLRRGLRRGHGRGRPAWRAGRRAGRASRGRRVRPGLPAQVRGPAQTLPAGVLATARCRPCAPTQSASGATGSQARLSSPGSAPWFSWSLAGAL
jgi:hypothetical protein